MLEDIFLGLLNNNETFRFTNTYRGMPVSNNGQLIRVKSNKITFRVPRTQIVCIRRDRYTYLNAKSLPSMYRAHLIGSNWKNETIELDNFVSIHASIGNRTLVRVEPTEPLPAMVVSETSGERLTGSIIEISIKGIALSLGADSLKRNKINIGDSVLVEYILPLQMKEGEPASNSMVSYSGIVRNVIEGNYGLRFRIGVQVYPDANIENIITKYVAQRQIELLKEIKQLGNEEPLI